MSPALAGDFFNTALPGKSVGFSLVFPCLVVGLPLPERAPDVGCWLQVFLRQPVQKPVGDSLHLPLLSTLSPTSFLPPSFCLPPSVPPTLSCLPSSFCTISLFVQRSFFECSKHSELGPNTGRKGRTKGHLYPGGAWLGEWISGVGSSSTAEWVLMAEAVRPGGSGGSALGDRFEALAWGCSSPQVLRTPLWKLVVLGGGSQIMLFCVA